MNLNNLLTKNTKIKSCELKKLLFKNGIKENKCESCGITKWMDKPIICHLHHIDGDNTNNTLENLQILCPNCHSQTDNYCSSWKHKEKSYCKLCGKQLGSRYNSYCRECFYIINRKVERPTLEVLQEDFKELKSYTKIARKYKVSDHTIRKWCIYYNWIPKKE